MAKDKYDKLLKKLQKKIGKDELKEYNEYVLDLFQRPKNWGSLPKEEISVRQAFKGPCGDTLQFFLKINDADIIEKASFITDGCTASVATASHVTLLIEGKSLDFAEKLQAEQIEESIGGLPFDHRHCAELADRTLKKAILKYKKNREKKKQD